MNGYVVFYREKRAEVYAETSYQAQQKAAILFKAKQPRQIAVMLAEKDSKPVIHTAVD